MTNLFILNETLTDGLNSSLLTITDVISITGIIYFACAIAISGFIIYLSNSETFLQKHNAEFNTKLPERNNTSSSERGERRSKVYYNK